MQTKTSSRHLKIAGAALLAAALPSLCTAQLTYQLTPDGFTAGATATWANDVGGAIGAVSQSVAGAQPQLVAGVTPSGEDAVRFDGGDLLTLANVSSSDLIGTTSGTLFFVLKPTDQTISSVFQWGTSPRVQFAENGTTVYYAHGPFPQEFVSANKPGDWGTDWHVVTLVRNGNTGIIRIDGQESSLLFPAGTGVSGTGSLNIGAAPDGTVGFSGDIAEVQVWSSALDSTQIGNIEAQLTSTYLTPIPEPSEYAMMFGALCVAGAFARRQWLRKQANAAA